MLAETRNVDDQVAWLDDSTVIYGLANRLAGRDGHVGRPRRRLGSTPAARARRLVGRGDRRLSLRSPWSRVDIGHATGPPGLRPERLARLVRRAVESMSLDLAGATVLTEAATGPYVVTPVIAALGGADAVDRGHPATRYGTVDEVDASRHGGSPSSSASRTASRSTPTA